MRMSPFPAVYLNLHDVYWSILNEAPWRPLDHDYSSREQRLPFDKGFDS
jgi:hypothetical protein